MCRFAVIKSSDLFSCKKYLKQFSLSAKNNPAPDGDEQKDGWGMAYLRNNHWEIFKSSYPIWEDKLDTCSFYQSNIFLFHARSATFKSQKDFLYLNQPYLQQDTAFVFNGLILRVKLRLNLYGEVGARKIFSLILKFEKKTGDIKAAIWKSFKLIEKNSQEVKAFNLALVRKGKIVGFNFFKEHPDYYQLWIGKKNGKVILASNKFINSFDWSKTPIGRVFEVVL